MILQPKLYQISSANLPHILTPVQMIASSMMTFTSVISCVWQLANCWLLLIGEMLVGEIRFSTLPPFLFLQFYMQWRDMSWNLQGHWALSLQHELSGINYIWQWMKRATILITPYL